MHLCLSLRGRCSIWHRSSGIPEENSRCALVPVSSGSQTRLADFGEPLLYLFARWVDATQMWYFRSVDYSCLPFPAAYCLESQESLPNCSLEINSQKIVQDKYGCFTSSPALAPSQTTVLAVQFLSHFPCGSCKGDIPSALPCPLLVWSELPCHIPKGD